MKEHPIIFSSPMVQAILQGRKTMTRRIIKPQPVGIDEFSNDGSVNENTETRCSIMLKKFKCPYGQPGDLLWVRETFDDEIDKSEDNLNRSGNEPDVYYRADYDEDHNWIRYWKPSIHMPKKHARIWLQIESIRVERLLDISDKDALSEGIERAEMENCFIRHDTPKGSKNTILVTSKPVTAFATLWNKINGPQSWFSNPWVWVITFKILSTQGHP